MHILSQAIQVHTACERMRALSSYSRFTIRSPPSFSQVTYLQVIRDNMSVLASWARNKNRSVVITLLANLVRRSNRAWLASKSQFVCRLSDGLSWQSSWWLRNFESFVEARGCVEGTLSDWLAQNALRGGSAGRWREILERDAAEEAEGCLAGLHCGGRYIVKKR